MATQTGVRLYPVDGVKPYSLNEAYATMQGKNKNPFGKGGWKNKVWRRKTAEAKYYQWLIQDSMAYFDQLLWGPKLPIPTAEKLQGIALSIVFYVPPRDLRTVDHLKFKGRDVSNYVKLIEDAVFEYLGRTDNQTFPQERAKIQDSSSIEPLSFKRESWDDQWHIHIYLTDHVTASEISPIFCGGYVFFNELAHTRTSEAALSNLRQCVGLGSLSDYDKLRIDFPAIVTVGEGRNQEAFPRN